MRDIRIHSHSLTIWINIYADRMHSENEMIGDAISYPRQHDDWLKTILIGGLLIIASAIPVLGIVATVLIYGYFVRVLRSAARDEATPPVFDEWPEMLIDGIKYLGIFLAYYFIPAMISIILLAILGFDSIVGLLLMGLLMVVAMYLFPVALTNFALTDSIDKAFDLSTITDAAFTREYFVAVVLAILVGLVLGIIGSILSILLVGIGVLFYMSIVVHYIFARGCCPALGRDTTEEFAT